MPDLPAQLDTISQRMEDANPVLYRHLALYLQVLRQILPGRVEQACFHLATQIHPHRYAGLPVLQRQHLHRRIQALAQRCCSLLTVEQLASLAAQMAREQEKQVNADPDPPDPSESPARRSGSHQPPDGSIQLGLGLPLSPGWFGMERLGVNARGASESGAHPPSNRQEPGHGEPTGSSSPSDPNASHGADHDDADAGDEAGEDGIDGEADTESGPDIETARAMVEVFRQALGASLGEGLEHQGLLGHSLEDGPDEPGPSLWQQGQLPRDPHLLLVWLEGMEQALTRRLRNLSHALNVELLKVGLSPTLLPVNLLDAVLGGQVESMGAPANLLRLQMPFDLQNGDGPLETITLLLRSADLEMEEPRLRTCRRRLQQHRQDVHRMSQEFRRLQRRLKAHEAETLWLQDIRTTRPDNA